MKILNNKKVSFESDALQRLNRHKWIEGCNKFHKNKSFCLKPLFCNNDIISFCFDIDYFGQLNIVNYNLIFQDMGYAFYMTNSEIIEEENRHDLFSLYSSDDFVNSRNPTYVFINNVIEIVDSIYAKNARDVLDFCDEHSRDKNSINVSEEVYPSYYYYVRSSTNNYYLVNEQQIVLNENIRTEEDAFLHLTKRDIVEFDVLTFLPPKDSNCYFVDNTIGSFIQSLPQVQLLAHLVENSYPFPKYQTSLSEINYFVDYRTYSQGIILYCEYFS